MPKEQSPEQRNRELFSLNYDSLTRLFHEVKIVDQETGIEIGVTEAIGYPRLENSRGPYKAVLGKRPGEVCYCVVQGHPITLVAALDAGEPGGCVKLHRGTRSVNDRIERIPRAGDITRLLGIQRGQRARLAYLDESSRLYLIRMSPEEAELRNEDFPRVPTKVAIRELDKILGS